MECGEEKEACKNDPSCKELHDRLEMATKNEQGVGRVAMTQTLIIHIYTHACDTFIYTNTRTLTHTHIPTHALTHSLTH